MGKLYQWLQPLVERKERGGGKRMEGKKKTMLATAQGPLGNKRPWWSTLHPTSDSDWPTWPSDEPHFFATRFHAHWPFIQSLKISKETSFYERPTMETHGCIRKRMKGWEMVENWMVFIGREGHKTINRGQKTCFFTWPPPKTFEKHFQCGADHRPNESDAIQIISSELNHYFSDFVIRINTIMLKQRETLALSVGSMMIPN